MDDVVENTKTILGFKVLIIHPLRLQMMFGHDDGGGGGSAISYHLR